MNRTLSRRVGLIMATGFVAGWLGACGAGGSDEEPGTSGPVSEPEEDVTITFASWVGNDEGMQRLYDRFREEHPKITVEFQDVPAEQSQQKLTTQIAGGNPPDAAFIDAGAVADFASREALVNLDGYIEHSEIVEPDDYVEAFRTFGTFEGSLYGLPFDGESTGLFYRTDLFEEAGIDGPPTTWEEFRDAAQTLTKPDQQQYGYQVFAPEASYYWYPWLWQAGGALLSDDGKSVEFNSDEAIEAAEFYIELVDYSAPDYLNSNSYDGRVGFANGQVAMYMAGAWFAGVLDDEFPKISGKWAAAPLPEGEAGCATTIAGDALVIFAGGKEHDAAWKWIEFLSKPENIAEWTYEAEGTLLPPLTSLLESEDLVETKPILEGFAEAMECGITNTVTNPKWSEAEQVLNEELGKAIYGEKSAADAVNTAATKADEVLAD